MSRLQVFACILLLAATTVATSVTPEEEKIYELVLQKKLEDAVASANDEELAVMMVSKKSFIRELINFFKELIDNAARNCMVQLVKECQKAPEFLKCGRNFMKDNKGRCMTGGSPKDK